MIVCPTEGRRSAQAKPVTQNLHEEQEQQGAIRGREELFRAAFEQSPVSTQIFTPDGRTVWVNRAWEKLWGVTLKQLGDYNVLADQQLVAKGVMPHIRRAFAGE